MRRVRIGTRGSALALAQARLVGDALKLLDKSLEIEIVPLVSRGDLKQGTPHAEQGDKKDWIAGLEEAVLDGRVDFTINSSKDVPLDILPGTELAPILTRENPLDVFISKEPLPDNWTLFDLPRAARVGTASLRRQAQLLLIRPDAQPVNVRGNITTRITKLLQAPALSGIIIAAAGINRLSLNTGLFIRDLPAELFLPSVNQGILAAQFTSTRSDIRDLIRCTTNVETSYTWCAERSVIAALGADCRSAVGVFAENRGGELLIRSRVLAQDGSVQIEDQIEGEMIAAEELGRKLGEKLLALGAKELLFGDIGSTSERKVTDIR